MSIIVSIKKCNIISTNIFIKKAKERSKEKQAGDYADLFGTNQHYSIPTNYEDFGRRFVLSYPYFEVDNFTVFQQKKKK